MPIQLDCPNCNRPLRVPDNLIGRKVKCTNCQTVFTASTGDEPAPPPAPEESIRSEEPRSRPSSRREQPRDDYDDERRDDDRYDDEPPRRSSRGDYQRPHRGGMILTFGIVALISALTSCGGLLCCFLLAPAALALPFGILAFIMGHSDLKEMKADRMDPSGQGVTQAGYFMGIAAVIIVLLDVILGVILFFTGVAMQGMQGMR